MRFKSLLLCVVNCVKGVCVRPTWVCYQHVCASASQTGVLLSRHIRSASTPLYSVCLHFKFDIKRDTAADLYTLF